MGALIRLAIVGFLVLSIIYVCVSLYSRSKRKAKLATWWEEAGRPGDREAYIRAGLEEYDGSLRRRLILAIYVVPAAMVGLIIYLVNYA